MPTKASAVVAVGVIEAARAEDEATEETEETEEIEETEEDVEDVVVAISITRRVAKGPVLRAPLRRLPRLLLHLLHLQLPQPRLQPQLQLRHRLRLLPLPVGPDSPITAHRRAGEKTSGRKVRQT